MLTTLARSTAARAARHTPSYTCRRALSYYSLFPKTFPSGGPPNSPFSLPSVAQLRQEYLQLQAHAHPDKLGSTATDAQRTRAEAHSSLLSVAFRTLTDPLRRAQHILAERHPAGDPLGEDAAQQGVDDEQFLMDVLMAREGIEDAASADELEALLAENKQKVDETVLQLEEAFGADELDKARVLTQKLSYWTGIERQIQDAIEHFN